MKKNFFCSIFFCLLANFSFAQDFNLYWKYKDYPGSMSFVVPGFLVKSTSIFIKGKEERRLIRRLGKSRIMIFEKGCPVTDLDIKKFANRAEQNGLDELITVRDGKTNVRILVKERRNKIKKLIIFVRDEEEFVMVSMKCNLRFKDLNALIKKYTDDEKDGKIDPEIPIKIPVIRV